MEAVSFIKLLPYPHSFLHKLGQVGTPTSLLQHFDQLNPPQCSEIDPTLSNICDIRLIPPTLTYIMYFLSLESYIHDIDIICF